VCLRALDAREVTSCQQARSVITRHAGASAATQNHEKAAERAAGGVSTRAGAHASRDTSGRSSSEEPSGAAMMAAAATLSLQRTSAPGLACGLHPTKQPEIPLQAHARQISVLQVMESISGRQHTAAAVAHASSSDSSAGCSAASACCRRWSTPCVTAPGGFPSARAAACAPCTRPRCIALACTASMPADHCSSQRISTCFLAMLQMGAG
jgi:hypothetical protein